MVIEKIQKLLKITKFCGDLELQDGTNLVVDANFFNVGVTVSVLTKDGLTPLPTGSYTLNSGDIINVVDGVVKEIISPVVNKPIPDPIANQPQKEDGGMNWGGPHPHEQMLATDPTQTTGDTGTTTADSGSTTLTLQDIIAWKDTVDASIADLQTRVTALEGSGADTTQMKKDLQLLVEKTQFAKEIKTNSQVEVKDANSSRMDLIRKITKR